MTTRTTLSLTAALVGAGALLAPTASAAPVPDDGISTADPMTSYVMERDGRSRAEASVCTEGGDSGGAYIGVGNLAQGMTSGGRSARSAATTAATTPARTASSSRSSTRRATTA
ncbi:hypothetical protein DUHN55_15030 [Helicobacter pylori]